MLKIIDKENAKRLKKRDPVKVNAQKQQEVKEFSPMDPPDYTNPPAKEKEIDYDTAPLSIKILVDEHKTAIEKINDFENTLRKFKQNKWLIDKQTASKFKDFFIFFDNNLLKHNRKEEKYLFPILHKYLIKSGEHNNEYETAIDLMEDDHSKILQLGTLIFNFLGLSSKLPDIKSQSIVADIAYEKSIELIELLRIHIYQEDNTLFPLAIKYLSKKEFEKINNHIK